MWLIHWALLIILAQLAEVIVLSWSKYCLRLCTDVFTCVCLDVNQSGTNRCRCTQKLVILHAQTHTNES